MNRLKKEIRTKTANGENQYEELCNEEGNINENWNQKVTPANTEKETYDILRVDYLERRLGEFNTQRACQNEEKQDEKTRNRVTELLESQQMFGMHGQCNGYQLGK